MKKGISSLLGLAVLIALAMALLPMTSFAAATTSAVRSHSPHIFRNENFSPVSAVLHGSSVSHSATSNSSYTSFNLSYQGGPVMAGTTSVYAIFWEPTGNVSANYNNLIKQYFNDVGGSPLYQIANQYTQAGGGAPTGAVLAGSWVDSGAYPEAPLLDSDIQHEVTHAQQVNGWQSSNNNIFFVFTERNANLCIDSTKSQCASNFFCAYHNFFGTNTIYAAMPYAASFQCNPRSSPNSDEADQTINVASHEQMEAATDPFLSAWFNNNPNSPVAGEEIGDLCNFRFGPNNSQGADVTWSSNHSYIVQKEWNNAISSCALTTSTAPILYQQVNRKSGLVLDISGGSTSVGAHAFQWNNHLGHSQEWTLVPDGPFFQIMDRNSGLVLGIAGGSTNAGADVIQWTNTGSLDQQWWLFAQGGYEVIVNAKSNLVLDITGGSTSAGTIAFQWFFHSDGLSQQWGFVHASAVYKIQDHKSNLVMGVSGGSTARGANAVQWTDTGALDQRWGLVPEASNNQIYQLVNLKSSMVLGILGGSKTAGAPAVQWNSTGSLDQQWQIVTDGSFVLIRDVNSGLTLGIAGGSTAPGAQVIQWNSTGSLDQQWTFVAVGS